MEIGPTSMTMDIVARSCGISKRTLYEHFPDKRTLIMESLNDDRDRFIKEVVRIFAESDTCYEALFSMFSLMLKRLNKRSQAFIDDIKRLYPEVLEHNDEHDKATIAHLSGVLTKAQGEGYVLPAIDTHIAAFLLINQMRALHNNPKVSYLDLDIVKVHDAAFLNFMRGVSTIKGIDYIEEALIKRNKQKTQ